MRTALLTAMLILCPVVAMAQDPVDPPAPVEQPAVEQPAAVPATADDVIVMDPPMLTSIAMVVIFAIFGTELLKRLLGGVPVANSIPVWLYVVLLAGVFTYLANQVFHTLDGNLWSLMWSAVFNAAIASGIRDWIRTGPTKTMKASVSGTGS